MGAMSRGKPPVRRPEAFRGNIRPLSENAAQSVKQRMQPDFRRTAFCLFCHMSDEAEELKIIYIHRIKTKAKHGKNDDTLTGYIFLRSSAKQY